MLWQDSDVPGRDHVANQRLGLAASLGLGLETATRAYLNLLYVDQDNIPDGYVPTIALPAGNRRPGKRRWSAIRSIRRISTASARIMTDRKGTSLHYRH